MTDRNLSDIRRSNDQIVRLLQTINNNIIHLDASVRAGTAELIKFNRELTRDVDLDKLVEDSKKIAEAGRNFEEIQLPNWDPNNFSVPLNGVNWCLNDKVRVIDGEAEGYHGIGRVVNAKGWPNDFQLAVDFSKNEVTFSKHVWFPVGRLEKIAGSQEDGFVYHTSGHDLDIGSQTVPPRTWIKLGPDELPAGGVENAGNPYAVDTNGCLFPWQWRHNLGMDKLAEEVRLQHQPHENHPMTEEAFRIYNAGLVAEFVVKTKQEEQK